MKIIHKQEKTVFFESLDNGALFSRDDGTKNVYMKAVGVKSESNHAYNYIRISYPYEVGELAANHNVIPLKGALHIEN